MITEALFGLIEGLIDLVVGVLPDLDVPVGTYPAQFATVVGSQLGGLNDILPITETATFVGWVLTLYVPVVLTFYVFRWIWAHIPFI